MATRRLLGWFALLTLAGIAIGGLAGSHHPTARHPRRRMPGPVGFEVRTPLDTSGFALTIASVERWENRASLIEVAKSWVDAGKRAGEKLDAIDAPASEQVSTLLKRAMLFHSEGKTARAAETLEQARSSIDGDPVLASKSLGSIIYYQGVTALRRGEDENCVQCRGESSCILPFASSARHSKPEGSRRAIGYFSEYLAHFPDDLEVRWLLNLAHMTLGEYPGKVAPAYLVPLERFLSSEFDIGRFRDVAEAAGVNKFNQSGGAVMEDFDGDDLLDLVVTCFDPTKPMTYYRNKGDGSFEDRSDPAGVLGQLGGLYCIQGDYNNDGRMDLFIPRGAWLSLPIRPTLLRNDGGKFVDVTAEAGLLEPANSISAAWADFDNDGALDLFVCCENQPNRLYRNKGDGTFEDVAASAGVDGDGETNCKGATWIDVDNDGDPDLFLNYLKGMARLFRNDGKGRFDEATIPLGIAGPRFGFSCWTWDYDNDGWLDLFATSYDRSVEDVVKGLIGQPHRRNSNKLYRNLGGQGFADVTAESGLDMVFATMGSNFADFDNDGFLDFYLATGEPSLSTLVPNRMFRNVAGKRFAEITATSGTGHLQKGHAVACGDYDGDGDVDLFVETGGATEGDRYHNLLFANPGQGNHWLTVKLVGEKTNRAAIGARITVVTAGDAPMTVRRHVSSGSSFGANPLRQTFGLAKADRVATIEVHWPTSGTTQVFRDVAADQTIEISEFAGDYRRIPARITGRSSLPRP